MKFSLVDRIVELEPGVRIVTRKAVTLSEEYLADHFPTFPVLPGVLMLEAMVESAGWLVHAAQDFAHSLILLRRARNVTYKSFVQPGQVLRVEVTCRSLADEASEHAGVGTCDGVEVVRARFELSHSNLASRSPTLASVDDRIVAAARSRMALLTGPGLNEKQR